MITIYGSPLCPDCVACKKSFDLYEIPYVYRNVTGDLYALKDFLELRDKDPIFDRMKAIGDIGLPTLVLEDKSLTLDWEKYLTDLGFSPLPIEGKSCSLDGKGC